jgi:hypothetical protein
MMLSRWASLCVGRMLLANSSRTLHARMAQRHEFIKSFWTRVIGYMSMKVLLQDGMQLRIRESP